jgi:predicted TIM-barrel fold metal-dependent hydrolase
MADYSVISADAHLEIPVTRWVDRVPAAHRDRAPRLVKLDNGGDAWIIEGQSLKVCGLEVCGENFEDYDVTGVSYDGSPGTGDPAQRLAEQDRDGIDAEVLFAGVGGPNFWRSIKNDEAYKAVVHAYNEFIAEEYCPVNPRRLLGMGVIPETGIEDALAELRYSAAHGLRGVTLNAFPSGKTFPSEEDDRFYREAIDLGMAITVHVALFFLGGKGQSLKYDRQPPADIAIGAKDPLRRLGSWAMVGGFNAVQLTFSGVFERIPELQIYFGESHIGWIPHFLEQMDSSYDRNMTWIRRHFGLQGVEGKPSELLKQHIHWGFLNEPFGVEIRHHIGVDRIMWGSDFPHSDSDWPRSREVIDSMFKNVPDDERQRMVSGNAVDFFNLR